MSQFTLWNVGSVKFLSFNIISYWQLSLYNRIFLFSSLTEENLCTEHVGKMRTRFLSPDVQLTNPLYWPKWLLYPGITLSSYKTIYISQKSEDLETFSLWEHFNTIFCISVANASLLISVLSVWHSFLHYLTLDPLINCVLFSNRTSKLALTVLVVWNGRQII